MPLIIGMKTLLLVSLSLLLLLFPCRAEDAHSNQADQIFQQLVTAQMADDYDAFVSQGTPQLKAALTKTQVDAASSILSPRLKAGYDVDFFGQLNQRGFQIYLYRLRFKQGDDVLATMTLKGSQVAGILFQ